MRELFVYYRVREADAPAAARIAREFQARLRAQHPALLTRLLRRPQAADGFVTWMEVYAAAPDGIDAALQAQIEIAAAALRPLLDGERHTEVFIDATPA
ncbi:MAG TPA: DUF4936 family protein [Burkholderiaceae bacterium]|nr:DUF4936 family protein [Burkholderiaceae bacterium]